ncbi:hypothetical protein LCGC14_0556230 [marine sediment metagenome]|uniref:Uncharacterized protein n=1 Tax=marine sediment metagenome TaxID=412755 RepID=A0A0F9RN41_9ZZZZ
MVNKAEVGRFDGELKTIAFSEGDTVSTILSKAGMSVGEGEMLNDDSGAVVNSTDIAVDGKTYYIVGNYKQGSGIDEVQNFEVGNLADAIGDVDKERAEIQKEKVKVILRDVLDRKDVLECDISRLQKELKEVEKDLKVFSRKK